MNRCITIDLSYMYECYAIVIETDDYWYNENLATLILFKNKDDYDEHIKNWEEEQPYTGRTWRTLYKKQ